MLRLIATLFMAGIGISAGSQAPEFAQQYQQRLGGAADELRIVIEEFDQDARNNGLDRKSALEKLIRNPDSLVRDRGQTMTRTIERQERISTQLQSLQSASDLLRPFIVMKSLDDRIARRTLDVYKPAVPLTVAGLAYGVFGMFVLGVLAWLTTAMAGLLRRAAGVGRKSAQIKPS